MHLNEHIFAVDLEHAFKKKFCQMKLCERGSKSNIILRQHFINYIKLSLLLVFYQRHFCFEVILTVQSVCLQGGFSVLVSFTLA